MQPRKPNHHPDDEYDAAGVTRDADNYHVPAPLVHKAILSIIGGILTIAGYMAWWASEDRAWKSSLMQRLSTIERDIGQLQTRIEVGILPRTEERLNLLGDHDRAFEDRIRRLEEEHRSWKQGP